MVVLVLALQPTTVMTLDADALPILASTQLRPRFALLSKRTVAALAEPGVAVRPELDEAVLRPRREYWRKAAHLTLTDGDPTVRITGTEGRSVDRGPGRGHAAEHDQYHHGEDRSSFHAPQTLARQTALGASPRADGWFRFHSTQPRQGLAARWRPRRWCWPLR